MHIPPFFLPQLIWNYIDVCVCVCVCVATSKLLLMFGRKACFDRANDLSPTIINVAGVPLSSLGKQLIPNYIYVCGNIQSSADVWS